MSSLQTTIDHLKGDNEALAAQVDAAEQGLLDSIADAAGSEATASQALITSEGALAEAQEDRSRAVGAEAVAAATRVLTEEALVDAQAGVTSAGAVADAAEAVVVPTATPADLGKLKAIASVYGQPSLELDFVNQRYTVQGDAPWLREDLDPATDLTFTRASTATYFDKDGVLQTAVADEMRFDHDPVTGEPLGVLIELSRTNAAHRNDDLASFFGTYASAPHRDNTVYQNIEETELGIGGVTLSAVEDGSVGGARSSSMVSVTSPYALSAFIKAGSASSVSLDTTRNGFGDRIGRVTLDTLTGEAVISGVAVSGGAVPLKGGWWRLWVIRPVVDSDDGSEYVCVTASGLSAGESITVAGINAEVGSYPTSYIPTAGAPVTRASDSLWRDLASEYSGNAVSVVASGVSTAGIGQGIRWRRSPAYTLSSGSHEFRQMGFAPAGSFRVSDPITYPSTASSAVNVTSVPYGDLWKSGFSFERNVTQMQVAVNGTHRTLSTREITWEADRLNIVQSSGYRGVGYIRYVALYPRAMTEAELIEVTS